MRREWLVRVSALVVVLGVLVGIAAAGEAKEEVWGNRGYIVWNPDVPQYKRFVQRVTTGERLAPESELAELEAKLSKALSDLEFSEERRAELERELAAVKAQLAAYQQQPATSGGTTYTVVKGDSLWKIAKKHYGDPLKWPVIYNANKDKIRNPNRIYPGQVLVIPAL